MYWTENPRILVRSQSVAPILGKHMIDLISVDKDAKFYIDLHGSKHTIYRPWAILEMTKYGPKCFDIYFTKEQAETAAKHYGLTITDKPTGP